MWLKNEFQVVFDRLLDDFRQVYADASKSDAVPFGQERIPPRQLRAYLGRMTTEQRRAMIDNPDSRAALLNALKKG